jgi:hypothetical protein
MRLIRAGVWAACAAALAAAGGCSREPKLVPVTGLVKLDGKPVAGVRVYFWPEESTANKTFVNRFAIGFTGADGRFVLHSSNGDGIAAGEYKVTFARPLARGGKAAADPNQKPEETGAKESLPAELTDPKKTRHTAAVSDASSDFVFEISSK